VACATRSGLKPDSGGAAFTPLRCGDGERVFRIPTDSIHQPKVATEGYNAVGVVGSTGNLPVPFGNLPNGMGRAQEVFKAAW
jgi:hypothetical protein